ncbi:MAG: hypothetical protein PVF65_08110 [Sphingomonadales bacterium]|jgi:hypothetical protein
MSGFGSVIASIAILCAFGLVVFGIRMVWNAKGKHLKGWLMMGVALILLINVYLLSLPVPN